MSQAERATKASQETDYLSSDLSEPKYKYDLVVGTTAQAINATMKQYLFENASEPVEIWYGQETAGAPVVPVTAIDGVDPFATPDKGEPPQQILDSDFVFAIKAGFGLPDGVDPLSVPDILILSEDRQKVTYVLFFNTFEIVTLDWGRKDTHSWGHFTQPSGDPILFNFLVDMNFDEADPEASFSHLPPETRDRLKDLNTDTAFSVQQLYLDLNNAGLQNRPTIAGIPADSDVYITLEKDFVNTYWEDIAKDKKFILGYAAKAKRAPADAAASLQPTALNFATVPHYDASGAKTDDFRLYTLNYLMNSEERPLEMGATFPWNWITSSDVGSYHGAMAVRREVFAEFLNESLSRSLQYVCIDPSVTFELYDLGLAWRASHSLNYDSSPGKFTYVADHGPKILNLSYSKDAYQTSKSGLIRGHFKLTSAVTGTVSVSGSEITVVLNASLNIDFDNGDLFGVGHVEGLVGAYSSTAILVIAVDGSGKLTVSMKSGYPNTVISPPSLSKGAFSGIDGVDGVESSLESSYSQMAQSLTSYERNVESFLNSTGNMWVFPGGQTFLFKQAAFSNFQDMVTHITYADPS